MLSMLFCLAFRLSQVSTYSGNAYASACRKPRRNCMSRCSVADFADIRCRLRAMSCPSYNSVRTSWPLQDATLMKGRCLRPSVRLPACLPACLRTNNSNAHRRRRSDSIFKPLPRFGPSQEAVQSECHAEGPAQTDVQATCGASPALFDQRPMLQACQQLPCGVRHLSAADY
jgi:hypothetical protein